MIGDSVRRTTASLLMTFAAACASAALLAVVGAASASATTYLPGTPVLDTVTGGPWNTSQGDAGAGEPYAFSDLLPTFTPGGSETTLGGVNEPNLAVYPSAEEPKVPPYPSGVAGTPGPLDGYCSSLGGNPETGTPVPQPAGTTLPMSPYYFPDVVRNADGSLTGYFDYRPKDADEAITVARSTDDGRTWTTEGEALEENSGYCPTADTNDDGQGHPFVTSVGGTTKLYTLPRPAGDYEGVGLLVHNVEPSAVDPLAALPATESVGIDPNTFAAAQTELSTTATNIPVTTLGSSQGPNEIVAGPYVDYTHNSPTSGSAPTVITCTGTTTTPSDELTGCTIPSGTLTVGSNDDLVQVMEEIGKAATVPAGPNIPSGEKTSEKLKFAVNGFGLADATSNSNALAWLMNNNAPNRVYIDGRAVYCFTTNTNPITTNLQNCTSPSGSFSVAVGNAITGDPMTPPSAQMTTGLIAPDGIVGTLPNTPSTFNGHSVPSNATVMLYTEKIVNYFVEGELNGSLNAGGTTYTPGSGEQPQFTIPSTAYGLNYQPFPGTSEPLPPNGTPFTIYTSTTGTTSPIFAISCTNWSTTVPSNAPAGSVDVFNCTGGTAGGKVDQTGSTSTKVGEGTGYWIGGPNAAVVPFSVLSKIGEGKDGKTSGPGRLFGNNEDYTVLRAAYTTNGVNFTDLGAISGSTSGTGNDTGSYNDLSNPFQQTSPSSTSPTNLNPGEPDTTELRYIGSRGTIITNPNGSLGMFLSGSWASDGDSDAFNQIFYTESSNGQEWSVPKVVLSTEYEFAASAAQDKALEEGKDEPLGISAYYSGRAYGPAVVQNPDGSLTMVFAGYRLPKPIEPDGTKVGINPASQYTVGTKDPALYRDILTMQLTSSTSPGVSTTTSVDSSDNGTGTVGSPVTYTATVSPFSPGTGTPTGTVSFTTASGSIAGCTAQPLGLGSPDTATCTTAHGSSGGSEEITATYSGDSNYATSSGSTTETVDEAPAITSTDSATFTEGSEGSFTVDATGTPTPTVAEHGSLPAGVTFDAATDELSGTPAETGRFPITFTAFNGVGSAAEQSFTLTVLGFHITTTTLPQATPGASYSVQLEAAGGVTPYIWRKAAGMLPHGLTVSRSGLLSGTVSSKVKAGSFTFTVAVIDSSSKHHEKATASFTLQVA
jgi:Bacterial Ig-like domain (group 3)/Putative Ig domain